MNNTTLALLSLRSLALLFSLQGDAKASNALILMANTLESGGNIDRHMRAVADAFKAGKVPDWDDLERRIQADADRLHGAKDS